MAPISCNTIKSILDPSEIIFNWTCRKIIFWTVYAGIAAGAVLAELYFGWIKYVVDVLRTEILPLGIVLFLIEPLMILLSIISVRVYPKKPKLIEHRPKFINGKRKMVKVNHVGMRRRKNKHVAVVIACHNSRDIIPNTVEACLKHVKPQQIFIVDNGNSEKPTDDSKEVLQRCSPKSHYIWNGFGNKTLAQYAGVMACKKYKYVLVLDDDVILPEDLDLGLELVEGKTVGVVYPIRACHPKRRYSLFVEWQSLEYQLTGYNKLLQHKSGTVQYPHGAASLWERGALKKALRSHDTIFYGEDAKLGIWSMKNGHDLKMKPDVVIYTESPTTFLGEMPNFWTQRVRSWDMALHCYIPQYINVFLCTAHSSILGTLLMKLTQGYTLFSIFADWLRLPVLILSIGLPQFYIGFGLYLAVAVSLLFLWNAIAYWNRKDLRLSFLCIITYPIYACLVLFTRFFGLLRAVFIYLPNYKRPPKIPEIEEKVIDSWNEAALDEEKGGDYDSDSEGSTASTNSGGGVREPVWLTDEDLISVGIGTTASATTNGDGMSVSVATSPAIYQSKKTSSLEVVQSNVPPPNSGILRNERGGGYALPLGLESPHKSSMAHRSGQQQQRSSQRGYPSHSKQMSHRNSSSGPVDLDSLESNNRGHRSSSRSSSTPVDLDQLESHNRNKPRSSQPASSSRQHVDSKRSRPVGKAPESVQRWMHSVNSERRVQFSDREVVNSDSFRTKDDFNRMEV